MTIYGKYLVPNVPEPSASLTRPGGRHWLTGVLGSLPEVDVGRSFEMLILCGRDEIGSNNNKVYNFAVEFL